MTGELSRIDARSAADGPFKFEIGSVLLHYGMLQPACLIRMKKTNFGCFVYQALGFAQGFFSVFRCVRFINTFDGASELTHFTAVPFCLDCIGSAAFE